VQFRFAATDFLRSLGRLRLLPGPEGRYDREVTDFIAAQQEGPWPSATTCRSARWQVTRFLEYLEQSGVALAALVPADIDGYFLHMAQRWSRNSLRTCAKILRAWFAHCEKQGYLRAGLADAILLPRVYQQEGLPIGPTWDEIGRMLSSTAGDDPASVRDHAVLLLLSVYGLRSGEVRRLQLENLDWSCDQIRIVRSKSGRKETLPIEPRVGNAIVRYLRQGRPKADSRALFLTLRAPHRPLSAGGLYNIVRHHLSKVSSPTKGRGPHALRHACARHLLNAGRTFKEVGDHLGHRSPDATRIYAKIDLSALRRVAFNDLGGLA
jgi:site-specific recombinase XerD